MLILLRLTFVNGGNWNASWFIPAMLYFGLCGLFYMLIGLIGLRVLCKTSFSFNFSRKTLCLVAISYSIEFSLLLTVFIQSVILFSKHYTNPENFDGLRIKTIKVLITHLAFKLLNVVLSLRYTD
jgi:hypothetical protein